MAQQSIMRRSAVVAGGTGLVGSALLEVLCTRSEYAKVVSLGRRRSAVRDPKLIHEQVDFECLPELPLHADVFCALGTTLKRAGSKRAFEQVDVDFVVRLAEAAQHAKASHFVLVSAIGADPNSALFYNRSKGRVETLVRAVGLDSVCVFRPSLLLGERQERRPGEAFGKVVFGLAAPLMRGRLAKYRPVSASSVARAMVFVALSDKFVQGYHVFESHEITELCAEPEPVSS